SGRGERHHRRRRRGHLSDHPQAGCTELSCQGRRESEGTLPLERQGSGFGDLREVDQTQLVLTCHEAAAVVYHPPAKTHGGGSQRKGSPATSLRGQRVSRGVFHLRALRPRPSLLQRPMPPANSRPTAAWGQRPASTECGRSARSSRPAATVPLPPASSTSRDGSGFDRMLCVVIIPGDAVVIQEREQ